MITAEYEEFTEVNPDKGTETGEDLPEVIKSMMFTEVNPDKGTETSYFSAVVSKTFNSLQKLTPIRGRKLFNLL